MNIKSFHVAALFLSIAACTLSGCAADDGDLDDDAEELGETESAVKSGDVAKAKIKLQKRLIRFSNYALLGTEGACREASPGGKRLDLVCKNGAPEKAVRAQAARLNIDAMKVTCGANIDFCYEWPLGSDRAP